MQKRSSSYSKLGFTLIELLILVMIAGILSAIMIPSWITFVERQHLNKAQNQVHQIMQAAKSNATRDKITWQVSFRQVSSSNTQILQWAIHPAEEGRFIPNAVLSNEALWHDIDSHILIDQGKNNKGKYETSVVKQTITGPWRVQFNHYGCPVSKAGDECGLTSLTAMGRVTLRSKNGGKLRRCVIISTLLGAIRDGTDHPKVDSTGKYCH